VTLKLTLLLLTTAVLSACAPSRYQHAQDFTPEAIGDLSKIKDAVPVSEPRSPMGNPERYTVLGREYRVLEDATGFREEGIASWYGMKFHGHRTSNGETFDVYQMTAAHKNLPLPSYVRVTRKDSGASVIVRVNDRGPFHQGRIIDLSYAAAVRLGIDKDGTAPVSIEVIAAPLMNSVHWLQIGAVSTPASADRLTQKVRSATDSRWLVATAEKQLGERTLHRVRLGPVKDTDLDEAITLLKNAGFDQPLKLSQHQLQD